MYATNNFHDVNYHLENPLNSYESSIYNSEMVIYGKKFYTNGSLEGGLDSRDIQNDESTQLTFNLPK